MDDKYQIANFGYVLVSKFVILDRLPIMEMYRERPDLTSPELPLSGWVFASGREENQDDFHFYSVRSLLAADASMELYLLEPAGSRFIRNDEGIFERIPFDGEGGENWSA